ncbi:hypothetical protein BDD43_5538 [Mucilaginibacter gracilis]|uniref:Uncharacterized protein n=1 Tax=Mucilaginibacter gracilis TaxID=423350 RepID=A0A495JA55_9SPHI|nr:hypothetical protein [Mucilaginibacter gracilis]RKR85274.1 hypothetical protein BDD43_5538 [Mucilaginibacter gracilis]
MLIDNTAALQYLFNDDIFLLEQDMDKLETTQHKTVAAIAEAVVNQPATVVDVPVVVAQPTVVAQAPAPHFNHLGANAKQFLIICSYPTTEQMDEKHLTALASALQRKELAVADVAILNIAKYPAADVTALTQYFKPTRLLILGTAALLTGWDKFALNQLQNSDGIKALYTYSFAEMMGDRDKTKAFWEQMKVL